MISQYLNTLYVQTDGAYLSLDHETVLVRINKDSISFPLHHLMGIVAIGRVTLSSPLLARCAADGRNVVYLNERGEFLYRIEGPVSGNVLLRKAQFECAKMEEFSRKLVQSLIAGKLYNSRHMLQRLSRETSDPNKKEKLKQAIKSMKTDLMLLASEDCSVNTIRGIEGINAKRYYEQFPIWLKIKDPFFSFKGRNRRPPRDAVNATLSFLYRLLLNDYEGAVQAVGLDPQIGFLHVIRPGRPSLALDLMEELRPILADRIAISMINRKQLKKGDFVEQPGGAVFLNKKGRTKVINEYQEKKKEEIFHPATQRKIPLGVLPFLQAQLLARSIRNDHLTYQPYLHGVRG